MQLRELIKVALAGAGRLLLATVLGAVLGAGLAALTDPVVHVASARAYLVTSSAEGNRISDAQLPGLRKRDYADLLTSNDFLQSAVTTYGLTTSAEDLRRNLEISSPQGTALFDFTYTDRDPTLAAAVATAAARQFVVSAPQLDATDDVRAVLIHDGTMELSRERRWIPNAANGAIAGFLILLVVLVGRHLRDPRRGDLVAVETDAA